MSSLVWSFLAVAAFVTGLAQVLRGADLNDRHLTAHVVTGSIILGVVGAQLLTAVSGRRRGAVDFALAALWVWFAIVPWIVADTPGVSPAGQYHDHVHLAVGLLMAGAALWNAWRTGRAGPAWNTRGT